MKLVTSFALVSFLAALLLAALVPVASSATTAAPKLVGTVGPGYTITLTKGGKKVTTLKAGKYTFAISDKSSSHSFALQGPNGFSKNLTTVGFVGTKVATIVLKKGKYKYYCTAHSSFMLGRFTVT